MEYKIIGWEEDYDNGSEKLIIELNSKIDAENAMYNLNLISKFKPYLEYEVNNQYLKVIISKKAGVKRDNLENYIGERLSSKLR